MFGSRPDPYPSAQFEAYAHRGLALDCPENTLAAFAAAAECGVSWIETDVRCSRDGKVLVFHDATLDRVAARPGKICQMGWVELKQVELAGGHSIPSLEEALNAFPDLKFNIDVKDSGSAQHIAEVIAQTQASNRVRLASFSGKRRSLAVRRLRAAVPGSAISSSASELGIYLFFVLAHTSVWLWPLVRKFLTLFYEGFDSLQVPHRYRVLGRELEVVTPRFIAAAHRLGLKVMVWTVDDPNQMRKLLDLGVDGLVSNRVDLLAEILATRAE